MCQTGGRGRLQGKITARVTSRRRPMIFNMVAFFVVPIEDQKIAIFDTVPDPFVVSIKIKVYISERDSVSEQKTHHEVAYFAEESC